jgi:hypothetical protein
MVRTILVAALVQIILRREAMIFGPPLVYSVAFGAAIWIT